MRAVTLVAAMCQPRACRPGGADLRPAAPCRTLGDQCFSGPTPAPAARRARCPDRAIMDSLSANDVQAIDQLRDVYARLRQEVGRVIVGQRDTIERLAICLFARGHALLMGVPGLAKTLLVRKLAETMSLKFSRIQFTP